tara:strand:- start:6739 stop:6873 length:135 start_codon:yes stop_codon:yes gene_type:complete
MTKEFNEWMASIGNIYYANDKLMDQAFQKIEKEKNKRNKICQTN